MVRIRNKEYSGNVINNNADNDKLTVVVYSVESLSDISDFMLGAREVIDVHPDGTEKSYKVTTTISVTIVSQFVYSIEFSTKAPFQQDVLNKLEEQSNAIDDILVALLEV